MDGSSFRILGPIELWVAGERRSLGGPRQLGLLALLLLHANRAVSADRLVDELWGAEGRGGAGKRLQMAVARLRAALAPLGGDGSVLRTVSGGYALSVPPGDLDAEVFGALVQQGCRLLEQDEAKRADEVLGRALGSWRGPPLAEVAFADFAQPEIRRLEGLRLLALDVRTDAQLQQGRHHEIVGELEARLAEQPDRERLAGQLMLALYRCGRQADALQVYQSVRAHLGGQLGLEPGPALTALQAKIFQHAPELHANGRSAPLRAAPSGAEVILGPDDPVAPISGLPPVSSRMIGRDAEQEAVKELLMTPDARLITLVGPGGVGKTRLALSVAQTATPSFREGSCWVELAGLRRAADVGTAVLRALSATSLQGEDAGEAARRHLSRRQLLLVLDNFEHVLDAARLVAELVSGCPHVTILITSRQPLELRAEHVLRIGPLSVPRTDATVADLEASEAGALFLASVQRHDNRFAVGQRDAAAVARLCRRLDGLPLALELAAGRAGLLGLTELDAQLDRAFDDLPTGPRDSPLRHRTLDATIAWSYELLDPPLQDVFVQFAVFAGGATLDSARAVTGAPLTALEALLTRSLLERSSPSSAPARLDMLDTVRSFALRQLDEKDFSERVHADHVEHYLEIVQQATRLLFTHAEQDALARLDSEADNILAALGWALRARPVTALRLAGLLGDYWFVRRDSSGLDWLQKTLAAAGDRAPASDRARARFFLGFQLEARGEIAAAVAATRTALRLYRQIGDDAGISQAYGGLCALTWRGGDPPRRGRAYARAAVRHAELCGERAVIGRSLTELAPYLPPGERPAVIDRAAALLRDLGNHWGLSRLYGDCGYEALAEERVPEALCLCELSVSAAELLNTSMQLVFALGNLGLARLLDGQHAASAQCFQRQLRLSVGEPFWFPVSEALQGLAAVTVVTGDLARAARLFGAATSVGPGAEARIFRLLERDYFQPARQQRGIDAWQRDERAGAQLSYEQALSYALEAL